MSTPPTSAAQQASRLLRRLLKGLDDRRSLPGGAAREKLDAHLVEVLAELPELLCSRPVEALEAPPPRSAALAMALALHSHPHLQILFGDQAVAATSEPAGPPLPRADWPIVFMQDNVVEALGLAAHELDDLREEIDRRAGRVMKQTRAVEWLWSHFGLPQGAATPLFDRLFPGAPSEQGRVGLIRRGPQLYVVLDQVPAPPLRSLYLSWAQPHVDAITVGSFRGRYADQGLRQALARGLGGGDDEIVALLDRVVTVIPRANAERFLVHDQWRSRTFAGLTELATPYTSADWLTEALLPEDVPTGDWLEETTAGPKLKKARAAFDQLAMPRVTAMMRQIYAALCARLIETGASTGAASAPWTIADLNLLDLGRHLRAVLGPLLEWTRSERTAALVAAHLQVPEAAARAVLAELTELWKDQLETAWCGPPRQGRPRSVQSILTAHLVQTRCALHDLWSREPDHRYEHRDLLLLFTAHYFAEAPVHRVWADGLAETGAPVSDPLAECFWGTWTRLLDTLETEMETYSGPFALDL